MQDLEIPPAVEEGEADGGADDVRPIIAVAATKRDRQNTGGGIYSAPMDHSYRAVIGNNNGHGPKPQPRHATGLCARLSTARSRAAAHRARTRIPASLPSSTICSSWRRFRRRRAR